MRTNQSSPLSIKSSRSEEQTSFFFSRLIGFLGGDRGGGNINSILRSLLAYEKVYGKHLYKVNRIG